QPTRTRRRTPPGTWRQPRGSSDCGHAASTSATTGRFGTRATRPLRPNAATPEMIGLSVAPCFDVGGELVERHRPSGGTRGVAGNAGMGHHHLRAATDVLE